MKILEMDPADIRVRQKLAELYVRISKATDAYEQYEAVAKYFASNGFHLKAIAIYKLMQRLDPSQVAIYSRLAELNVKQGLVGNALAEYRSLVDHYERNGMIADGIKILEKMRDLDPANLNVRVKLTEVLAGNDRKDEGLVELKAVLEDLHARRDYDRALKLYKMFLPFYPANKGLQLGLSHTFYEKGDYARGVSIIETLLKDKPEDPDLLRQLALGCVQSGNLSKAITIYRQLLTFDPTDLDMRSALVRCEIDNGSPRRALSELEEWKDAFFKAGRLESLKVFYEILKDQLTNDPLVLQTLDSIYELTGEGGKLLDIYSETDTSEQSRSGDFSSPAEEELSDSLLGTVDLDIDNDDPGDEHLDFNVLEEDNLDLQSALTSDATDQTKAGTETVIELDVSDSLSNTSDFGADFWFDDQDEAAAAAPQSSGDLQADLEEAEFYLQQGLYDDAEQLCREILEYAPDSQECQRKLEEIAEQRKTAAAKGTGSSAAGRETAPDLSAFDVDTELDALQVKDVPQKKVFRTDVDEQIAADDMESHYNLGIAYREMGLFDDAISEFTKAQREPARFVDCQILKSLSYSDKGDMKNAELMLQRVLDTSDLDSSQRLNLGYELGLLYEKGQRNREALDRYREVFSQDKGYRDVAAKISALTAQAAVDSSGSTSQQRDRISFL